MERTLWTDERIDDAFAQLRDELRELRREFHAEMRGMRAEHAAGMRSLRAELFQLKLLMLGGYTTILAAVIALHG
jgi:hypothetical protein